MSVMGYHLLITWQTISQSIHQSGNKPKKKPTNQSVSQPFIYPKNKRYSYDLRVTSSMPFQVQVSYEILGEF